jgi:hypothetical protein
MKSKGKSRGEEMTSHETMLRETAISLFAEADNIERTPGQTSFDARKAVFGEIVTEKHKKIGLEL